MARLTIDLSTCDVGTEAATPEEYAQIISSRIQQSWNSGADVVLLPEYTWMALERFVTHPDKLAGVAALFWNRLWPELQATLAKVGRLAVLGTVPWLDIDTGRTYNRAPILCDGLSIYQDKLHLTPWEGVLSNGDLMQLFKFKGLTFGVVICLDIEVPELSSLLRGREVDCLLVPSATENVLGVERIGRCASARAVELGCCVGVSHLVGRTESELVDENLGRLAWFTPSQLPYRDETREEVTPTHTDGWHTLRVRLDPHQLALMRRNFRETNPAGLTPGPVRCELISPG